MTVPSFEVTVGIRISDHAARSPMVPDSGSCAVSIDHSPGSPAPRGRRSALVAEHRRAGDLPRAALLDQTEPRAFGHDVAVGVGVADGRVDRAGRTHGHVRGADPADRLPKPLVAGQATRVVALVV